MKFIVILISLSAFSTLACAEDCKAIQDAAARLACFDKTPAKDKAMVPKGDPVIERAKAAVRAQLKDPPSARFLEVHKAPKGVCGQMNAKNGYGGYTGIILFAYSTADNQAHLVQLGNASDPGILRAIDAYDAICK
jgi:hypothetical protein